MSYSDEFKELVIKAIGDRSRRKLAPQVGCSPAYLGEMYMGKIPSRELVVRLAEVTGTDPIPMLQATGYLPKPNQAERFLAGIKAMGEEFGAERVAVFAYQFPDVNPTEAEVDERLADIRAAIERGIERDKQKRKQ